MQNTRYLWLGRSPEDYTTREEAEAAAAKLPGRPFGFVAVTLEDGRVREVELLAPRVVDGER